MYKFEILQFALALSSWGVNLGSQLSRIQWTIHNLMYSVTNVSNNIQNIHKMQLPEADVQLY